MGIHQLKRVDKYRKHREHVWKKYNEAFQDLPCILPAAPGPDTRHAYHLYTPLIDIKRNGKSRDWMLNALTAENIGVDVHYLPVHLHPFYRKTYGWGEGDYPNAEWIGERTLSLPLSAALNETDVEDVIIAFQKVLKV